MSEHQESSDTCQMHESEAGAQADPNCSNITDESGSAEDACGTAVDDCCCCCCC